jgi:hypothetical protein
LRVREALAEHGRVFHLRQVHGATVARAPWQEPPEADAAVAGDAGQLLAIETADCLPVLLADPVGRRVAAVHAGWRGTAQHVVVAAVEALIARGSRPGDLLAGLGPAIGACCYQVGPEVRDALGPGQGAHLRPDAEGRFRLDLRAANRQQLLEAGVSAARIQALEECTFCRAERYPSYRREGPGAGRMVSIIGFRASAHAIPN